jgi:predicted dehydrogenase/threonine dehydrogenase-like Zn-dependent dehydrogenase
VAGARANGVATFRKAFAHAMLPGLAPAVLAAPSIIRNAVPPPPTGGCTGVRARIRSIVKQVLQHVRSRRLEVADLPEPGPRAGGVLVRNTASLISAGTEKMITDFAGKSMVGKARERPDLVRQVMDKVRKDGLAPTVQTVLSKLDQPIPLGYSCAGIVEAAGRGAEEFAVGDRVACAGMGYASHADVVFVPRNLAVRVPDGVSLEDAAYVTVGAIALQGVRIQAPLLGESVAVIGLGVLGQLAVQILRASGCRVLGIDLDPAKVQLARELGAEAAVLRTDDVAAAVSVFTGGRGMDGVLIAAATSSNDPVELAGEIARDRAVVTMVGATGMEVPRKPYYEKELQLRLSRSYGPGRYDPEYEEKGRDYPIGYVRWTERRNMEEFLRLVATGQVQPSALTTHRFPIERAEEAYTLIGGGGEPFAGVMLTYAERTAPAVRTLHLKPAAPRAGTLGVGFVGAGNFARAVLLPRFEKAAGAALVGVSTSTGMNARSAGERFGFRYATTDTAALLGDADVHAVVVATRHASHARLSADALRAGKAVFVEKPLALDEEGLQEVLAAQAETGGVLTVGFNRRFSPLAAEVKRAFAPGLPLAITYRVNAGPIPRDHWIHDPVEGGGRIIGEVCHFVDLCQFLAGDLPVEAFAHAVGGPEGGLHDTVAITLRFAGGSVATIAYFATGDKSFAKERVEVFGAGTLAVLDDFREVEISRGGKRKKTRKMSQDKGFDEEVAAFVAAARGGGTLPIPLADLVATTRATFAIEESLRTGRPAEIRPDTAGA